MASQEMRFYFEEIEPLEDDAQTAQIVQQGDNPPEDAVESKQFVAVDLCAPAGCTTLGEPSERTTSRWRKLACSDPPPARAGHSLIALDADRVVLFGGSTRAAQFFDTTHLFQVAQRRWRQVKTHGPTPSARGGHTAVLWGRTILVFGGQCVTVKQQRDQDPQIEPVFFSDLWALDCSSVDTGCWRWSQEVVSGGPPARNGHSATVVGDHMYIFGGSDEHGPSDEVWSLHLPSKQWQRMAVAGTGPMAREGHCAWFWQGHLVIAGGRGLQGLFEDCFALDLAAARWEYIGTCPARCMHTATTHDRTAIMHGGVGPEGPLSSAVIATLPENGFSPATPLQWHVLRSGGDVHRSTNSKKRHADAGPDGRFAHGMALLPGKRQSLLYGGVSLQKEYGDTFLLSTS